MTNIYRVCEKLLQAGQEFVLATVFETKGSAPRTAGAKMIVCADGTSRGTIGGGRLENDVAEMACRLIKDRKSAGYAFQLTENDVAGMDMICGGSGEVWLQFMTPLDEKLLKVCQAAAAKQDKREEAWLITQIDDVEEERERQHGLLTSDLSVTGLLCVAEATLKSWATVGAGLAAYPNRAENQRFLLEPIRRACPVFIFGAGHVSQQLAALCENVGFRTTVFDDREEYACRERFETATEIVVLESFENWPDLYFDKDSYIVILTRAHAHDRTVLAKALMTHAGYIGMIGSRRKRDAIFQALIAAGFLPEDVRRVHSPIGLDIGAETPQELAVSIVGQLIKVRAEKGKQRGFEG